MIRLQTLIKPVVFSLALSVCVAAHGGGQVSIPAGTYQRGDFNDGNQDGDAPKTTVTLDTFQMDSNLVSYSLWTAVYNSATGSGYTFSGPGTAFSQNQNNQPVQTISWYDAVAWCNARSEMESTADNPITDCYYTDAGFQNPYKGGAMTVYVNWAANGYRLPTEAEWEVAARGGLSMQRFPLGMLITHQSDLYRGTNTVGLYEAAVNLATFDLGPGNFFPNGTTSVGSYPPNHYGLFDMAGNVQEWCWDYYSKLYYFSAPATDPVGPTTGSARVVRGGDWDNYSDLCCCAARTYSIPLTGNTRTGFRCVSHIQSQGTQGGGAGTLGLSNVVATAISYGTSLAGSSLSGGVTNAPSDGSAGTNVGGIFTFQSPTTVPTVGNPTENFIFTPTDSADFDPLTGTVSVTVSAAAPQINAPPTAAPITLGQTLASSSLTGGTVVNPNNNASVSGQFVFSDPSFQPSGTTIVNAVFVPNDTTDYTSGVTTSVNITVNPVVILTTNIAVKVKPTATAISFGQTLASSTLSGAVYTNSSRTIVAVGQPAFAVPGLVPNAGVTNVQVILAASGNYNSVTTTIPVTVIKAVPQVTLTDTGITYGQILAASDLTGSTAVNPNNAVAVGGTYAFLTPTLVPNAGNTNVSVKFTPTDTVDYTTATNKVIVQVSPAAPAIFVVAANGTKYGQSLSNSLLTASKATNTFNKVAVSGTFAFVPPQTPPVAGLNIETVIFTPTSALNYTPATNNSVTVNVARTTPVLTAPVASAILVGQNIAGSTLTGGTATNPYSKVSVDGSFAFTTPGIVPKVGTTNVSVTFTPTDAPDYSNATIIVSVKVLAAPTNFVFVTSLTASPITYGQPLSSSALVGAFANSSGVAVPGSVAFASPATIPIAGTAVASVIFTPTDLGYKKSTNNVSVTVVPAELVITANDAVWDETMAYPTFTVTCSGLLPQDIMPGADINSLVGTNTVFGTNLVVWSPAASNTGNLPSDAYANFIIPVLVGLTNNNYIVNYVPGTLTLLNSPVAPAGHGVVENGTVTPASIQSFLGGGNVDQAGLNTVLARYWNQSPPFITNTTFPGQTNFCFTVTNFSLTVQYSTDLAAWQNLGSPARMAFTDTNAASLPARYYRLVGSTNY